MPSSSRGRARRIFVAVAASVSLMAGAASAVSAAVWVHIGIVGTGDPLPSGGVVPSAASLVPLPTGSCSERSCNYVLIGSDSRAGLTPEEQQQFGNEGDVGGEERADTVMLVHTDPDRDKAVILSFPRDLWVKIPDVGMGKLNSAFTGGLNGGGPQRLLQTIADLTGLRIDHYLFVDFNGFQDAVDALGGVEMCPPSYLAGETGRIIDPLSGLDIAPGCQHMDGATALAFVRSRHLPCDNIPDFSRIGRQQQFLRALITQMLRPSQIVHAPGLVQPVLRSLHRDANFLPGDLVYLVGQMRGLTTGAAEFRAVPGIGGYEGSAAVVRMDAGAEALFKAIRDGAQIPDVGTVLLGTPISPANVRVAVIDDGAGDLASGVETTLGNAGFDVSPGIWGASDVPEGVSGAVRIVYAPGHDREATVLASYLPGVAVAGTADLHGATVAVVITPDYAPPTAGPAAPADCPSP